MSVKEIACKAENDLREKILERQLYGYATPEAYAKRAYEHSLHWILSIQAECRKEEQENNANKPCKVIYHLDCLGRDFVVQTSSVLKDIAYKLIDEAYTKWYEEHTDLCCEEFIHERLKYFGIE